MNWGRWIVERLPNRLRTVILFTLCMVYTAFVRRVYDEFVEWRRKMKIQMSGSPQVCMLKKVIYNELGVNIEIEEGNRKPYDFIITTAFSDVDKERQLFALLDRYKLAGKSYSYANAEVALSCEWGGYVCEVQTLFVEWGGYVCEHKYRPIYNLVFYFNGENTVKMVLQKRSISDMSVRIYRYDWNPQTGGAMNEYEVTFDIKKGDSGSFIKYFPYAFGVTTSIQLSKNEDETYIYKYVVV